MIRATVASFNVKSLIGPEKEYYKYHLYTQEEYVCKEAWLADQIFTMDVDIVGFQEIFEESARREVIKEADEMGDDNNEIAVPDRSKRYRKRLFFAS